MDSYTLSPGERAALRKVLAYIRSDETRAFLDSPPLRRANHIYRSIYALLDAAGEDKSKAIDPNNP
jgi:hypothetical protein